MQLADLYDADRRVYDPVCQQLAARYRIPHPLGSVQYAEGLSPKNAGQEVRSPWIEEEN